MVEFIPNIISPADCKILSERFYELKSEIENIDPEGGFFNTFGFKPDRTDVFDEYLDILKSKVGCFLPGQKLRGVNTYVREYTNDAILEKHIDREDVDITLSVCLHSTLKTEYPLCATYNEVDSCFDTKPGDAVLIVNPNKVVHWRDRLVCSENESAVYLFLHWKIMKGFL